MDWIKLIRKSDEEKQASLCTRYGCKLCYLINTINKINYKAGKFNKIIRDHHFNNKLDNIRRDAKLTGKTINKIV